uniref:Uncharacterized protein n=1 Tax=Globodera pallida TaxID=36090 RepID=A0A183BIR0_GLOPA
MVYSVTLNDSRIIRGKRSFNCSNNWLLERYKLSDKYALNKTIKVKSPGDPKFVFVTAADDKYYPSFRMLIANIKEKFGCKQHIIAYDLGKVTKNKEWMNEINSICNLEWRIFNFTQMADDRVRDLKSYAWKIFVIADGSLLGILRYNMEYRDEIEAKQLNLLYTTTTTTSIIILYMIVFDAVLALSNGGGEPRIARYFDDAGEACMRRRPLQSKPSV